MKRISPRMEKALRDGKELKFFAELWPSVYNDAVDTQSDFQASAGQKDMDFFTRPGFAALALEAETLQQTSYNNDPLTDQYAVCSSGRFNNHVRHAWQSFRLPGGRWVKKVGLNIYNNHNVPTTGTVSLYNQAKAAPIAVRGFSLPGVIGNYQITVDFTGLFLEGGTYWVTVHHTGNDFNQNFSIRKQLTDSYADGVFHYYDNLVRGGFVERPGEEAYFTISLDKYKPSGSFRTRVLDLGETPKKKGVLGLSYQLPTDAGLRVTVYGSDSADMSNAVTLPGLDDGDVLPPFRYWQVDLACTSNALRDASPVIDVVEALFPRHEVLAREARAALRHVDREILEDFAPLLHPVTPKYSSLKIIDRVATGGELSLVLEDSGPHTLQRLVSDFPLKNFHAALYAGADVPGLRRTDLLRFFVGVVNRAEFTPKCRRGRYSLTLDLKNPLLDLERKAPVPTSTGLLNFDQVAMNFDAAHVMPAMIDIIRNHGAIPARHVDLEAMNSLRYTMGDELLPAAAHVVRRSNADGLPDTRVTDPEPIRDLLKPLAMIADVYVVQDESSRITCKKHDVKAEPEAFWADEDLVRAGLDAVPIEDIATIDLGYDELLFNLAMVAHGWDGSGESWRENFTATYVQVDFDSAADFAPGTALYLKVMEDNLKEVSKWLGPEEGYNGATLARAVLARLVKRFRYPPLRLFGVRMPVSEFTRTAGSVVRIQSREIAKYRQRGGMFTFMVMAPKYERERNQMVFDLYELT